MVVDAALIFNDKRISCRRNQSKESLEITARRLDSNNARSYVLFSVIEEDRQNSTLLETFWTDFTN